jgi:hypothetical protein
MQPPDVAARVLTTATESGAPLSCRKKRMQPEPDLPLELDVYKLHADTSQPDNHSIALVIYPIDGTPAARHEEYPSLH